MKTFIEPGWSINDVQETTVIPTVALSDSKIAYGALLALTEEGYRESLISAHLRSPNAPRIEKVGKSHFTDGRGNSQLEDGFGHEVLIQSYKYDREEIGSKLLTWARRTWTLTK